MAIWPLLGGVAYALLAAFLLLFVITCLREREKRAAGRTVFALLALASVLALTGFGFPSLIAPVLTVFLVILGGSALVWAIGPRPRKQQIVKETPERIDERDVIFARFDLKADSVEFQHYYAHHPAYREMDEKIRRLPDILSASHSSKDPFLFALADAEFEFLERQLDAVGGSASGHPRDLEPHSHTRLLKQIIRYLGGEACGICELDPAYVYSHVGRGPEPYGQEIKQEHRFAVVFTVPMDFRMIASAPQAPVIVETAKQYVAAARIAVTAAGMIRRLGYPARAHMAGSNYQAVLPPLAWKAGLGELGRIGILITPRHGPRVRLGLLTTDLPLVPDSPIAFGVQDFCSKCRKCSENCPSQAIPTGEPSLNNGSVRWVIDRESCYLYWRKVGTDCARCIYVCPYSKPDTLLHAWIRRAAAFSSPAQALFIRGDNWFYGRHPRPHTPPFFP
jgi:ferredoxin